MDANANTNELSEINLLNKIIETTFPHNVIRNRFLDLLRNIHKNEKYDKIIIFYGKKNNGKSLVLNMIKNMFDTNSVAILNKISENDSSFNKKLVIYNDIKFPIKGHVIKHLLSSDENICYNNDIVEILKPIPKIYVIVSNVDPSHMISNSIRDPGLIRRLEIIQFNVTFVDDINNTNDDQNIHLKDESLMEWISNGGHKNALKKILL